MTDLRRGDLWPLGCGAEHPLGFDDELRDWHPDAAGDGEHVEEAEIALAALHTADIRAMQPGRHGKTFLRKTGALARVLHRITERLQFRPRHPERVSDGCYSYVYSL